MLSGFEEKLPGTDPMLDEEPEAEEERPLEYEEIRPGPRAAGGARAIDNDEEQP